MNLKQIFVIVIIAMFLIVPFASAKQESVDVGTVKQDKKIEEKAVDKTKEQPKEVKNKDKDITGKITVTDTDTSAYTITKDGDAAIKIKRSGEHTKAKVTIPKEELQKIDEDGDKLYGVLHIADDGTTTHDVVTESELIAGTEMVFSENIVNGYSGYWEKTQTGVTSGTTIDIPDVSGRDYYVTVSTTGSVPSYVAGIPSTGLIAYYPLRSNASDMSGNMRHGTAYNISYSNGSAFFNGKNSYIALPSTARPTTSFSILATTTSKNDNTTASIYDAGYGSHKGLAMQYSTLSRTRSWIGNGTTEINKYITQPGIKTQHQYAITNNNTFHNIYYNFAITGYTTTVMGNISYFNTNVFIGSASGSSGGTSGQYYGQLQDVVIYNRGINIYEMMQCYAGASGISFRPLPSYNFTGYNVAPGVEKTIDTDTTCTGLEYIDTTGGTHTVTVRIYFTEDVTKSTETKGAVYQNVSIVHTKQNATASVGSIAYELDPLYSGTPALSSNNTNATVTRNDTHAIISTGLVKQGQSFSYAVSVPDDHDHIIFLNRVMQWMGSGWDYVGVAPDDWTDAIRDIEVTVS